MDIFNVNLLNNSNMEAVPIGQKGLHLNGWGTGRMAMNIISLVKQL